MLISYIVLKHMYGQLRKKIPRVFTGMVKLRDYLVKLKIDPKVTPSCLTSVQNSIWQLVLDKLQELVDLE